MKIKNTKKAKNILTNTILEYIIFPKWYFKGDLKLRNWLKELRKKNKLSQKDVAEKLNTSIATYSRIELGTRQQDLNLSTIIKLSQIFNISLEEIKYFEGYEQKEEKEAQNKISKAIEVLNKWQSDTIG